MYVIRLTYEGKIISCKMFLFHGHLFMNTTLPRLIKGNSDRNAIKSFHPLTLELRVPVISRHAPILHYKV